MELIDKEALLRDMTVRFTTIADWHYFDCVVEQPTIEAVMVRHGQWIDARDHCGSYVCSECEYQSVAQYNFCPQCGAMMGGGVT